MKSCTLCGGKLDANMRCTFCGLDNTKNDDMYKHLINRNDCVDEPLTHVHSEPVKSQPANTYTTPKYKGQTIKSNKKKATKLELGKVIGLIIVIITLISSLVELFQEVGIEDYDYSYSEEEIDYDPYEYVSYDLPAEGQTYAVTLEPGVYRVGTHIPEGTYTAEVTQGSYGMLEIQDSANGIYLYENIGFDDEQMIVTDLRLYQDGLFIVSPGIVLEMTAENVQSTDLITRENTLDESYALTEQAVAGEDFPAGVYNIVFDAKNGIDEFGEVKYRVPLEDFEPEFSIFFDGSVGPDTYHNVVLLEGTVIQLEDLEEVTLVPCAEIPDVNFEEYYRAFY